MLVTSSLTMFRKTYALPVDQTHWEVPGGTDATFTWDYDEGRDRILRLYEKGKTKQWDASERLDWSLDVNPDNPLGFPPDYIRLYVSAKIWNKLDRKERANVRRHLDAWRFSQFLHGEQG